MDPDTVQLGVGVVILDSGEEEGESPASLGVIALLVDDPSEEHGHVGVCGGAEPLEAIDLPPAVRIPLGDGLGAADIASTRSLCHPLSRGPEELGIAGGEALVGPVLHGVGSVGLNEPGGTVSHGQRAAVHSSGATKQVQLHPGRNKSHQRLNSISIWRVLANLSKLVEPAEFALLPLIGNSHNSFLGGHIMELLPALRGVQLVHTAAPGVKVLQQFIFVNLFSPTRSFKWSPLTSTVGGCVSASSPSTFSSVEALSPKRLKSL